MTTPPVIHELKIEVDNNWDIVAKEVVRHMKALTQSYRWKFELSDDTDEFFRITAWSYEWIDWLSSRGIVHKPEVQISIPTDWLPHRHTYEYVANESGEGFALRKLGSNVGPEEYDSDCPPPRAQLNEKTFAGELHIIDSDFKVETAMQVKVEFKVTVHIPPYYQKEMPYDCCGFDEKDTDLMTSEAMKPSDPSSPHYVHRYGPGEWERLCYTEPFLQRLIESGRAKDPYRRDDDIYDDKHTWEWKEDHVKPKKTTCARREDTQDPKAAPLPSREPRPVSVRYCSLLSVLQ